MHFSTSVLSKRSPIVSSYLLNKDVHHNNNHVLIDCFPLMWVVHAYSKHCYHFPIKKSFHSLKKRTYSIKILLRKIFDKPKSLKGVYSSIWKDNTDKKMRLYLLFRYSYGNLADPVPKVGFARIKVKNLQKPC